jgi:hypothetical protein
MLLVLHILISDSYPDLQMGSAKGNNLGITTNVGGCSTSVAAGDMVLWSLNRSILQSGETVGALIIDANSYVNINHRLIVNGKVNFHNGSQLGITYAVGFFNNR